MAKTLDLFCGTEHQKPPRKRPRVMAHVDDGGSELVHFTCRKCGWRSGWRPIDECPANLKRGIHCEDCQTKNQTMVT